MSSRLIGLWLSSTALSSRTLARPFALRMENSSGAAPANTSKTQTAGRRSAYLTRAGFRRSLFTIALSTSLVPLVTTTASAAIPSICDAVTDNLVTNCGFESGLTSWTVTPEGAAIAAGLTRKSGAKMYNAGSSTFPNPVITSQIIVTASGGIYPAYPVDADTH